MGLCGIFLYSVAENVGKWVKETLYGLLYASQVALVIKNPPANAGDRRDMSSIPGSGRSPGERHNNPLHCSYLGNPMDRGTWRAIIHGVAQSRTWLKQLSTKLCHCECSFLKRVTHSIEWASREVKHDPLYFLSPESYCHYRGENQSETLFNVLVVVVKIIVIYTFFFFCSRTLFSL